MKENVKGVDAEIGPVVDGEKILEKKDRESKWRKDMSHFWKIVIAVISSFYISYHMYTSRFGMPETVKHRAIHVGFILILVFLLFPGTKKAPRTRPSVMDLALVFISLAATLYTLLSRDAFLIRAGVSAPMDIYVGAVMILLVLESCRRAVGPQLLTLCIIFLLYAYFGRHIPGVLSHRGYTLTRIIYQMYLTTQGIFGMPIGVSSTYLIIFVVLGAMLDKSGLSRLFNDIAMFVGGRMTGGPAKVSVIASALLGMISGSSATNVATTGAFTIPLMKKVGYKPYFAAAIEAAASTGGQFMPPIMGSVAFIMAEFLGVPYLTIAGAAIIPALLYFAGVFFQIDLRARRLGLKGLTKDQMPDVKYTVLRYGHMIIPIGILIFLLFEGRTPLYAAFYTVVFTGILSWVRKETRIGPKQLLDVAVSASRSSLSIGVAMANAGFVVAVLSMTGIGIILADNIVLLSGGYLPIALILCMVVSIILGMGLPTSACYVIAASIAVPILTKMGVPAFQAHFFTLYYACLSTITPPVALSAYVGAGMAGAKPNQVGWTAFRLAIAGFIVPFFFVYSPSMLLISDSIWFILWDTFTALLGTAMLAIAGEGFFRINLPIPVRPVFFIASIALIIPGSTTDIIGLAVGIVAILIVQVLKTKSDRNVSIA
ncbi:TRAP transporter permease [Oceanispirochaeta crateris]|uniref:TRAP transporter permease n=1 Tax=Oceanispirochaeta crateris TaxID=2518645 RepID=A0A5C1QQK4_9SPIO|nr:TRAP transporter permease [Oceanispirochaeta crateris]QEN09648.1 TRAP transporter permease [Oceanispirochaeta crateris]